MKTYNYPHTIENGAGGERLTFLRRVPGTTGDRLEVENVVEPGAGPVMHVHHQQEEALTVVQGRIGYQRLGEPARFAGPGETVAFRAGEAHKFWNAGEEEVLRGTGYIEPADNIEYFLAAIFESQKRSGDRGRICSTRRSWRGATEASSGWWRYRHSCNGSRSPSWWRSAGCSDGAKSTPTRPSPFAAKWAAQRVVAAGNRTPAPPELCEFRVQGVLRGSALLLDEAGDEFGDTARDGGDAVLRGETGDQTDQESRSAGTEPRVDFFCWTE